MAALLANDEPFEDEGDEEIEIEHTRERIPTICETWQEAIEKGFILQHEKGAFKDISMSANWMLSSCKIDGDGFGISELLSDSPDMYWQSDGPQPHSITVEFPRKTDVSFIVLFLDFKSDESYTPQKVVVRVGLSPAQMEDDEMIEHDFKEPNGWHAIDLRRGSLPKRCFCLQLQVIQNHQSGRDTHIRSMRVIGPRRPQFDQEARTLISSSAEMSTTSMMEALQAIKDENRDPNCSARIDVEPPLPPITTRSRHIIRMPTIR